MKRLLIGMSLAALLVAGTTTQSLAVSVYGDPAALTGNRDNNGGGLIGSNEWDGTAGGGTQFVSLAWDIVDLGGGQWSYEYTWSGAGLRKEISHYTLDLTDNCITDPDPGCVTGEFPGDVEFGNKDGITGAVKFDFGGGSATDSFTYFFESNRAPVYGDLCLVDGGGSDTCADIGNIGNTNLIWNAGFTNHDSMNVIDFVARPNGTNGPGPGPGGLPVPSTFLLLGVGLVSLGLAHLKKGPKN